MAKPTRIHYFYAEDRPATIWMWTFVVVFAIVGVFATWPLIVSPSGWTDPLLFGLCLVLFPGLGWFAAILIGWPVLGPMYYGRGLDNGEPFNKGDLVQILVGPHRDRIVQVYKALDQNLCAGSHLVYVALDDAARENCEHMFASYQVLLVARAHEHLPTTSPSEWRDPIPGRVVANLHSGETRITLLPHAQCANGDQSFDVRTYSIPREVRAPNTDVWVRFNDSREVQEVWRRDSEDTKSGQS